MGLVRLFLRAKYGHDIDHIPIRPTRRSDHLIPAAASEGTSTPGQAVLPEAAKVETGVKSTQGCPHCSCGRSDHAIITKSGKDKKTTSKASKSATSLSSSSLSSSILTPSSSSSSSFSDSSDVTLPETHLGQARVERVNPSLKQDQDTDKIGAHLRGAEWGQPPTPPAAKQAHRHKKHKHKNKTADGLFGRNAKTAEATKHADGKDGLTPILKKTKTSKRRQQASPERKQVLIEESDGNVTDTEGNSQPGHHRKTHGDEKQQTAPGGSLKSALGTRDGRKSSIKTVPPVQADSTSESSHASTDSFVDTSVAHTSDLKRHPVSKKKNDAPKIKKPKDNQGTSKSYNPPKFEKAVPMTNAWAASAEQTSPPDHEQGGWFPQTNFWSDPNMDWSDNDSISARIRDAPPYRPGIYSNSKSSPRTAPPSRSVPPQISEPYRGPPSPRAVDPLTTAPYRPPPFPKTAPPPPMPADSAGSGW